VYKRNIFEGKNGATVGRLTELGSIGEASGAYASPT
jgi:hypothetical protein